MKKNILVCYYQESIFDGLACRHEICVMIKANKLASSNLKIAPRWIKAFFNPEDFPPIVDPVDESDHEYDFDLSDEASDRLSQNSDTNEE
jgi:hypothetical protein